MKTALLLIDLQNEYFPGGKIELTGAEEAVRQASNALEHFRGQGMPVIHLQHLGTTFFLPDTEGSHIHARVEPVAGEAVFEKRFPNGFRETPLLEHLRNNGIERLAIAGMMTAMCVDATTRAAFDLGFKNVLLHDAMATRNLAFNGETIPAAQVHGAFLAALGSVYGQILGVSDFLKS